MALPYLIETTMMVLFVLVMRQWVPQAYVTGPKVHDKYQGHNSNPSVSIF